MADNSILPKAGAPLVDQTGRPTRAFYSFFNALVSNLQGQINSINKLVKNLALVIAALGGDPDSGEGIPDIAGEIDAKADKSITITGLGSIQGGGDLSQNRFIALDGDVDTVPGVSFYGSPDGSTKGWAAFSDNFAPSMDADDNVTLDLADLADSGTGAALIKITRDSKGRLSGTSAATTTDLTEGDNLYFTDARADARIDLAKSDPDGIASLVDGKLDPGQLPALAITDTFVVDDEAEMLALDCQQGDVAVRMDFEPGKSFILTTSPPSVLGNWQELLTPTGGVSSFNGRTGSVTPASGDYTFIQIDSTPTTLSGYGITDAVPSSRTVNGKALSANVTLSASDVGAEPAITAGTTSQYWRGDKTWQDFATSVRAAVLTGLSTATKAAITATDSVLSALGKLQAQISGKQDNLGDAPSDSTTSTRTLVINSNGYAGILVQGDYLNTTGEPGGAFLRLCADGTDPAVQVSALLSKVNAAGTDGAGGTYTGTVSNSVLLANSYDAPIHLGTNGVIRMTIDSTGTSLPGNLTAPNLVTKDLAAAAGLLTGSIPSVTNCDTLVGQGFVIAYVPSGSTNAPGANAYTLASFPANSSGDVGCTQIALRMSTGSPELWYRSKDTSHTSFSAWVSA